jgi:hypothetical protein
MATAAPALAGAAGGSAAADAFVSRMQSLVHAASRSSRLPRWLRRVIPHDAGPGASVAVVAAFVAAVIVAVVVIATVASALTSSGGPGPQAGSGNTGPAAAGNAAGLPKCNEDDQMIGTVALPASTASLARSYQQQVLACYGEVVSVTCDSNPQVIVASIEYAYTCPVAQNPQEHIILGGSADLFLDVKNGHWENE